MKAIFVVKFCILIILFCNLAKANGWKFWEPPLEIAQPNSDGIYEFDLLISQALTMTTNPTELDSMIVDYSPENQTWTQRNPSFRTKCTENVTILDENDGIEQMDQKIATVLQWDGMHRKIITINGKSPGQTIVVPLGAKVVMRVRNRLQSQSITLHVHGMNQRGRWFMDGVPNVAQCPIGPGTDFTYKFIADTPGTQWYHGHLMGDRSMGLLGGFVVLKPNEKKKFLTQEAGELAVGREYYAILQNWHPESVEDTYLDMWEGRAKWMGKNVDSGECIQPENAGPLHTGPFFGYLRTMTVLVNQKGWHRQEDILTRPSDLPLANFGIRKNENILIRLVNGGNEESFYVWIENHDFWVVAADGIYVKPKMVDSLVIHPGERYDLLVKGLAAPKKMPYYLIFESFEPFMVNLTENRIEKMYGLATLRYQDFGARTKLTNLDSDNVDFGHQKCTQSNLCRILSCPHTNFFTLLKNYTCLTNQHLENDEVVENLDEEILEQKIFEKDKFHEIMLNVHAGLDGWYFKRPNGLPYFHQENLQEIAEFCDPEKCDRSEQHCRCFHHYEFGYCNIVQMTLLTSANMLHPFHLHGTKFYVMRTGMMGDDYTMNTDLECADENDCYSFKWRNASFNGGNVPQMHENPVLRDTVMVSNKGYIVIRFRATNPGWYFGHCHLLYHAMDGMSFAYKVDAFDGPSIIPSPPANFPQNCDNFESDEDWEEEMLKGGKNSAIRGFWPDLIIIFACFYAFSLF